jgi:ribulose-5-phosphate 4-epimerase/fuculose-1-phosphate aldolase
MLSKEPYDGAAKSAAEAIGLCVLANRILANEKVVDAYGHISIRNPENTESFFISRAIPPEFVTESDILECAFDGAILSGNKAHKPYGERIIHAAVYKIRPDVHSVCHAHPDELSVFAGSDIPFRSTLKSCSMFHDGLPVYKDLEVESGLHVSTADEADRMAALLGKGRGLLIRNHGVVVACGSIMQAVMSSVYLRDAAAVLQKTLAMGGAPVYLGYDESVECTKINFGIVGLERAWSHWSARAAKAFPDLGRQQFSNTQLSG